MITGNDRISHADQITDETFARKERGAFWRAFGLEDAPDMRGKRVLEIGCGQGERCEEMVHRGAAYVVGLDIDEHSYDIAQSRHAALPEGEASKLSFHFGKLDTLAVGDFDIVVSENSFEHIMNVAEVLEEISEKLSPKGRVFLGFGPLYYSPMGDHGWIRQILPFRRVFPWPWGHVLFPEAYLQKKLSTLHGTPVDFEQNWPYLTLNRHTPADFVRLFEQSPLKIVTLEKNPAHSVLGRLFRILSKLPFGQKYLTWGIYAILENDVGKAGTEN